jgi:CubicO group peptidase (beta-lactamase class C family)
MVLDHTAGFPNWRENNKLFINFTPGTKFDYSGEEYEYLAHVVEHLTGKKIDVLMLAGATATATTHCFSFIRVQK